MRIVPHILVAPHRVDFLPGEDDVDALHVIGLRVGDDLYLEVLRRVPTDSPCRVVWLVLYNAVRFQMTARFKVA